MTIAVELEAQILRLYHVEKWRCGTIARQLRAREQREAQGDTRDATGQALERSREQREAGQQAGVGGREVADSEKPAATGEQILGDRVAVQAAEPPEKLQQHDGGSEMGD
jgi:hypothetical protein